MSSSRQAKTPSGEDPQPWHPTWEDGRRRAGPAAGSGKGSGGKSAPLSPSGRGRTTEGAEPGQHRRYDKFEEDRRWSGGQGRRYSGGQIVGRAAEVMVGSGGVGTRWASALSGVGQRAVGAITWDDLSTELEAITTSTSAGSRSSGDSAGPKG